MPLNTIPAEAFVSQNYHLWEHQWLLLTGGDFSTGRFNSMTVGWGSFGCMWGKPFALAVVRPTRHTYQFMEQHDSFTLCAFPPELRPALQIMGTRSGRDTDKVALSGLTLVASECVAAPAFAEAELVVECRKIYWDDIKPDHFLDPDIERHYPRKDYHRMYFGEILTIRGVEKYAFPADSQ